LLWFDMIVKDAQFHVVTSHSYALITFVFLPSMWCTIKENKACNNNIQHLLIISRNMIFHILMDYEYTYQLGTNCCLYVRNYRIFQWAVTFKLHITNKFNKDKISIDTNIL
jgi:hypothetical protein